jgi:hypothetical protein
MGALTSISLVRFLSSIFVGKSRDPCKLNAFFFLFLAFKIIDIT